MKHRLKYMTSDYKEYPSHNISSSKIKSIIYPVGETVESTYRYLKEYWNKSQIENNSEPEWREHMYYALLRRMDKLSWNIYRIFSGKKDTIDVVETINYLSKEVSTISRYSKFANETISRELFTVIKYLSKLIYQLSEYLS